LRESARIEEEIGNRVGASDSWHSLAQVIARAGRPNEAEDWYIKALTVKQTEGDRASESRTHNNLASLLSKLPGRLADAKSHAEQALAIKKTLDPAAAEIWNTYAILANIADRQGDPDAARAWRREERASYAAAPVSRHMLRRRWPLIAAVVQAASDSSARPALDPVLADMAARGWTSLVGALRRILDGERDEDALCASLGAEDSATVAAVLRGIADPATLTDLAPPDAAAQVP
jgi:tetratricopeptide (TPR) repeat protein